METAPPQTSAAGPSRRAFLFILILVAMDMIGFGLIIPVMPGLIEEVGGVSLSEAAVVGGWMAVAYSLAQFAVGPLLGNLSDRFGRRPLLLLAVFGLCLDYLLQAFAPNLTWLFVGRAISGVCGASWIIANAYIADITPPEDRGRAFGMMGAAFGLGFVAGPAIGGLLGELGPRVPFFVAAGIAAANFAYGWFVLPESLKPENRRAFDWRRANPFGVFRVFSTYPGVLPLCIVLFSFFFFSSVYPAIWPFWGIAKFGWSEAMVGASLAIFGVIMAVFQAGLSGPMVKRFGERRTVLIGLTCAAIAALGYGTAGTLAVVVVLMVIHGPEGFIHPMATALMSKVVPENAQGELQGGISAVATVSMLFGTVFFAQVFGWATAPERLAPMPDLPYFIASAGLVFTMVLFLMIVPRDAGEARVEVAS